MVRYHKNSDFEKYLLKERPLLDLKNITVLNSSQGFPVYSNYYVQLQKYIIEKVNQFNSAISKKYSFYMPRSSGVLEKNQILKHYSKRFPEKQYILNKTDALFLKPACCATAFSIWKNQNHLIKQKQIIHEVSDCYRLEKLGSVRALQRNCYFTMPDYHMINIEPDVLKDFNQIKLQIYEFFQDLLKSNKWTEEFVQIIRIDQEKLPKYKSFLEESWKEKELQVELLSYEQKEDAPYFEFKYELAYRAANKLFTLATIQIDYLFPKLFELFQLAGPKTKKDRVCLHFSQGSIQRLVEVLIHEAQIPIKGFKFFNITPQDYKNFITDFEPNYFFLIEDKQTLSQSLKVKSKYEQDFFPYLLVYGPKEKKLKKVKILKRIVGSKFENLKPDRLLNKANSSNRSITQEADLNKEQFLDWANNLNIPLQHKIKSDYTYTRLICT